MITKESSSRFFEVTVKFKTTNDKGRAKKVTRKILVEAADFGNAEAVTLAAHPDYEITVIKMTKVREVLRAAGDETGLHENAVSEVSPSAYELARVEENRNVALPPLSVDAGPKLNRAQRRALEREMSRRAKRQRINLNARCVQPNIQYC